MGLIKLTPEVQHLRKVARACAAGEISFSDYRELRQQVIANFGGTFDTSLGDDDTQPRWQAEPNACASKAPRKSSRRKLYVAITLALLAMLSMLAFAAQAEVIAPLAQRDPNPVTSPRLPVARLQVREFEAFPELGITQESVDAFLAQALAEVKAAQQPAEHGFTASELQEVAQFLSAAGVHREGGVLSPRDSADLAELVRQQKLNRGVSIVELQQLTQRVTEYYRARGLPVATAFLPSQEVTNGVVHLSILPGALAEVRLADGDATDRTRADQLLKRAFAPLLNKPVQQTLLESRILQINDLPGVSTGATLGAGDEVGSTRLSLNLDNQRTWQASAQLDNQGTDFTGEQRLIGNFDWLNPTQRGDRLSLQLLSAFGDQIYGSAQYSTPLLDIRNRVHVRVANNRFDWQSQGVDLDGDSFLIEVQAERQFLRTRQRSWSLNVGLARHGLELDGSVADTLVVPQDQDAWIGHVGVSGERVFDEHHLALDGALRFDLGTFGSDDLVGQNDGFYRLHTDAFAWTLVPVPGFSQAQRLSLRIQSQFATAGLPDTLRLALGGAGRLRSLETSSFSADRGVYIGLDLQLRPEFLPANGSLSAFFDVAAGEQFNSGQDDQFQASNIGVAWQQDWRALTSVLSLAFPLTLSDSRDFEDESVRLYWTLRYQWR